MRCVVGSLAALFLACGPSFGEERGGPGSGGGGGAGADGGGPHGKQDPGDGPQCLARVPLDVDVVTSPPDLLLVIDRSSSMSQVVDGGFTMKWHVLHDALSNLIGTWKEHIHYGLMLYPPEYTTCESGVVDVAPAPGTAGLIDSVLEDVFPGGGTPIRGTLVNARNYFAAAPQNPYGRHIILATDGLPMCELDAVSRTIAEVTALRNAGVRTYVLGFNSQADTQVLDQMAAAGGTGSHYSVYSPSQLSSALAAVTSEVVAISCSYQVESPAEGSGVLEVFIDGDRIERDSMSGWDYDLASEMLTFHGAACDRLQSSSGAAEVTVNFCYQID